MRILAQRKSFQADHCKRLRSLSTVMTFVSAVRIAKLSSSDPGSAINSDVRPSTGSTRESLRDDQLSSRPRRVSKSLRVKG